MKNTVTFVRLPNTNYFLHSIITRKSAKLRGLQKISKLSADFWIGLYQSDLVQTFTTHVVHNGLKSKLKANVNHRPKKYLIHVSRYG
jgi:hypothetical protein